MTDRPCASGQTDEIVELYFYDELPAAERAEADAHFAVCPACRESLADLREIEAALAARGIDAPEQGWTGFMARLDARLDALPPNLPTYQPTNLPTYQPTNRPTYLRTTWLRLAASAALVASGAAGGWTLSRFTAPADAPAAMLRPQVDRAIADAGGAGLERARVVLAGLAQKDEGDEWALERRMAATLLPEVRLIRQMSADRGRDDLADVLIDVETLLLQASYADAEDAEALARLRGMIDRRDVLMRLSAASDPEPRLRPGS
jgi:anti-sigma factor RsiW